MYFMYVKWRRATLRKPFEREMKFELIKKTSDVDLFFYITQP